MPPTLPRHSNLLFVSDLDGTLLGSDGTIAATTRDTLNGLIDRGMRFTVATARSPARALAALRGMRLALPLVCLNGAATVDPVTGAWLASESIADDDVGELIDLGLRAGVAPFLMGLDDGHEALMHLPAQGRVQAAFLAQRAAEPRMRPVDSLRPLAPTVSVTFVGEFERLAAIRGACDAARAARLAWRPMAYPGIPGAATLDISRGDVDKVTGVAGVASRCGVRPDEVVVFGDHLNDLALFGWAGVAVAVRNAGAEALAAADLVCGSNDDAGVACFLAAHFS